MRRSLPRQLAQVLVAVEQDVVEADEGRVGAEHLLADVLAPKPLLQRVEACRGAAMNVGDALVRSAHQQLAVEHAGRPKRRGDIGEAARNVVAGAAVEPRLSAGVDQLDADPVPFPLGGIIVERDLGVVERMGEHERAEHRHVADGRLLGAPLRPVEQLGERRLEAVPHLLDRLDLEPERIGQRLLGQPRADPDPKRARRQLEQGEAPRRIEMVEHVGKRARRIEARRRAQPIDRIGDANGRVVHLGRLIDRLRP